jgi:septum site-determining protein MinD
MAKTIAILSTKGGVGNTILAANIAVSLANDYRRKVCLIDLDLQAVGDMARVLDVNPHRAMADFINAIETQPANDVKNKDYLCVTAYGPDFLSGILDPKQSPHLNPGKIKDIFGLIEKDYDYIIVDVGKNFSEVFVSALNQANLILMVVTPDILSVYKTKWALETLQVLHFPLNMIKLVLNRAESTSSISWHEIRVSLPAEIIAWIPSQGKIVGEAVNRGVPVVVDNPKSKVTQAIRKLSGSLYSQSDLYVEHCEIDQLRLKEASTERSGEFWRRQGLTEELTELTAAAEEIDDIVLLKRRIHNRLIEELNIKRLDLRIFSDPRRTKELRNKAEMLIVNLLAEEVESFISSSEVRKKLVREILDEALGFGPLEDLLADTEITDIMTNNKDEIYVERKGRIELTSKKFISNDQVKTIIERIIAPIGRRIDESVPMVDARLPDGSRVNAIIPPLSLTGPTLTIRKFRKEKFSPEELIELKTMNVAMAEFIKACVIARKNIIVSGGTGSGKTTILNVLSGFIPNNERIITIEDAAELKLLQDHWVRLESRSPNIEGKGAVTIRDLFRNTLRMRPDRIIIGECRGLETLDMLQAMNTGHDGSMTTVHANSTQDVLVRLDSMILMSGIELPIRAIREMIASAIDMIVHTARLSDGTRKIVQVSEVMGMKDEIHVNLEDIFVFNQTGIGKEGRILGEFQATGYIPSFLKEIRIKGIPISDSIFKAS